MKPWYRAWDWEVPEMVASVLRWMSFPSTFTGADCLALTALEVCKGVITIIHTLQRTGALALISRLLGVSVLSCELDLLPCSLEGRWRVLLQSARSP